MGFFLVVLTLVLPGYLISLFIPSLRGFFARVAYSLVFSVAFGVVISTVFAAFQIQIGASFLIGNAGAVCVLGFLGRGKLHTLFSEWKETKKREKAFFVFCFTLAVLAGIFVAFPHLNYKWPIHADEWWQVGTVQNVMEGRSLNTNPYLFDSFVNDKPGFSSYLAGVFAAGGVDPLQAWAYLPAFNVFLICFFASLALFSESKRFLAAGILPILLVALRSNAYSLGWWFFVPSTFSLLFVVALLFFIPHWRESFRGVLAACLIFAALALVYLPYALLLFLILLPSMVKHIVRYRAAFFSALAIIAGGGMYVASILSPYREYWNVARGISLPSFLSASPIIQAFFVPLGATFHVTTGSVFLDVVVLPLLLLAAFGVMRLARYAWGLGMRTGIILGIANILLGIFLGVSFLVFYERTFYFVGIMIAIAAALGIQWIKLRLEKKRILFSTVLVAFLFTLFFGYFTPPQGTYLYYLVHDEDLAAVAWLNAHRAEFKGMAVLADEGTGTLITPFTRLPSKISLLTSQNISALINAEDVTILGEKDCSKKEKSMIRLGTQILYAHMPQECPFLKALYESPHVFLYLYSRQSVHASSTDVLQYKERT